jgi:hypothetical protein
MGGYFMEFIELSGRSLLQVVTEEELTPDDLSQVGVTENTIVRVNRQGDIEVRRNDGWDVIGGLLGDFEHRIKRQTGLDWAREAS